MGFSCVLLPKLGSSIRMCTDYRHENTFINDDSYSLLTVHGTIDYAGNAAFMTKIDLLSD